MKKQPSYHDDIFFNIRFKPDMHARLKAVALDSERSVAGTIRLAIREYLERVENEPIASRKAEQAA